MKSVLLLCFLVSILVFTHSSRTEPDEVSAEIRSYGLQLASGLRMMRDGSNQMVCFRTYSDKLIELAERSERQSKDCIDVANNQRGVEMERVKDVLPVFDEQLQRVEKSWKDCTDMEDVFKYLWCSIYVDKENQKVLSAIETESSDVYKQTNSTLEIVEVAEHGCISAAQRKAKEDTDIASADLQKCLNNK